MQKKFNPNDAKSSFSTSFAHSKKASNALRQEDITNLLQEVQHCNESVEEIMHIPSRSSGKPLYGAKSYQMPVLNAKSRTTRDSLEPQVPTLEQ